MQKSHFSRLFREEANELPFFIFMTIVLGGIAGYSIFTSPSLRQPLWLLGFCCLMLIHILLYWTATSLTVTPLRKVVYIVGQGLVAFLINLLGQNSILIFSLYLGLIGISAGLFKFDRGLAGVVAFEALLSLLSYGLVLGWSNLLWWAFAILPMMSFVIIYIVLYNRQSEARARAQTLAAELEKANRRLADYAARVEELTLTNERQRMARELHDTLSQGLAGLILKLEAADAHLASNRGERARAILQQTLLQARATLSDARSAIDDLRAVRTETESLEEILRAEVARFTDGTGLACALEIDPSLTLTPELAETLRCITAEALTNTARHARARSVEIRVLRSDNQLQACYQDDGAGFDPQAVEDQNGHYGLLGMRERACLAGGSLKILSLPGQGTIISLRLPLEPAPTLPEKTA